MSGWGCKPLAEREGFECWPQVLARTTVSQFQMNRGRWSASSSRREIFAPEFATSKFECPVPSIVPVPSVYPQYFPSKCRSNHATARSIASLRFSRWQSYVLRSHSNAPPRPCLPAPPGSMLGSRQLPSQREPDKGNRWSQGAPPRCGEV